MTTSTRSPSSRTTLAVALLGLSGAWNAGNVGPVADEIASDLDVSLGVVGLLSGTFFLGASVLGLVVAAPVGEYMGLARGVKVTCLMLAAGNVLFAISPWFAGLALGRVGVGLAFAFANTLGAVWARQAGGVTLLGIFGGSFQLGIALALLVGSALSDLGVDWRVGFVVSAALAVAAFVAVPADAAASAGARGRSSGFLRAAVRHVRVYRLSLVFLSIYGVPMILSAWLVVYLSSEADLRKSLAGTASFLLFGLSALFRIVGAKLALRGTPHAVLVGTLALAALGLAALTFDTAAAVVLVGVGLVALGFGVPYAIALSEAQQLYPEEPSEPVALMTLVALIPPIIVIPIVGRALESGDAEIAFGILAVFVLLSAAANLRRSGTPLTAADPRPG
jgi:predicted MFS family arabinose efflux permease